MQNNLLLGNSTVAAGYVSVARDVSAIWTSARENSFTGSSFKKGIPATVTRKRMRNIRFTENRLLATKSYPAATEIDVILHKCHSLKTCKLHCNQVMIKSINHPFITVSPFYHRVQLLNDIPAAQSTSLSLIRSFLLSSV